MILAIDGESTEHMTHLEAQNKIKGCIDEMVLSVDRWVVATCPSEVHHHRNGGGSLMRNLTSSPGVQEVKSLEALTWICHLQCEIFQLCLKDELWCYAIIANHYDIARFHCWDVEIEEAADRLKHICLRKKKRRCCWGGGWRVREIWVI